MEEVTTKSRTLIIIKPTIYHVEDKEKNSRLGIERQHMIAQVKKVLKLKSFEIEREITTILPFEFWTEFYAEHKGKSFFDQLIKYMDGGVVTFMVVSHEKYDAIATWRDLMGGYNDAALGKCTLRGIYGDKEYSMYNFFHGSDSQVSFEREESLLFKAVEKK